MQLSWWNNDKIPEEFNLDQNRVIAFCGAGGKTSSIHLLEEQLAKQGKNVYLSTTTKIYTQNNFQRTPNVVRETFLGNALISEYNVGLYSKIDPEGKLTATHLSEMMESINNQNLWLVEADGAKHAWLKAPAAHEPVWPKRVDLAVGCFSAHILGRGLQSVEDHGGYGGVHRQEVMMALTGLSVSQEIDIQAVAKLVNHKSGMFQGLNEEIPRVLLVTQVKREHLEQLTQLSSLVSMPVLLRAAGTVHPRAIQIKPYPKVILGAVLAGGMSRRMACDENKLFIKVDGNRTLLEQTLQHMLTLKETEVLKDVLIVSPYEEALAVAVKHQLSFIENTQAFQGMSSGLKWIAKYADNPQMDGVLIYMGDQPLVNEKLIKHLIQTFVENPEADAIIPTYEGVRLNPVLVNRRFLKHFEDLHGDEGAKKRLTQARCVLCPWYDPDVFRDIDTKEDLEWLKTKLGRAEGV